MNTVLTPTYYNGNVADDEEDTAATTAITTTTTNDVENNNNNNGGGNVISGCEKKNMIHSNHDFAIVNGIIAKPGGAHHVLVETIRMWRCLITNLSPNDDYDNNDDDDDDDYDDCDDDNVNNDVHVFAPYIPLWKTNNDSDVGNGDDVSTDDTTKKNNSDDELWLMESEFLKIFDIGTASSLMTSIALAGILDPIVNRPMPNIENGACDETTVTPFSLFWDGSVHGGVWNCPYTLNSVSGVSGYVLGKVYNYYDSLSIAATINAAATAVAAATATATATATQSSTTSGETNGDVNNNNNNSGSSSPSTSSSTTIDAVPSTLGEPMPDLVRERLEILS